MADQLVAVVTGGTSGIGLALCVALARRNYSVVTIGRDEERRETALAEIRAARGGNHIGLALDVSSPADMQRLSDECGNRFGRVDVLIASAGIGRTQESKSRLPSPTTELSLSEWQRVLGVNLHGVFLANKAVLPLMIAQGRGDIINVGSSTTPRGMQGRPFAQAYSATKFAMTAFTRTLALEVEPFGIRVNTIFPGPVRTPLIEDTMLDAPFGGRIEGENFADSVLGLLDIGEETRVSDPHILPLPTRRKGSQRDRARVQ